MTKQSLDENQKVIRGFSSGSLVMAMQSLQNKRGSVRRSSNSNQYISRRPIGTLASTTKKKKQPDSVSPKFLINMTQHLLEQVQGMFLFFSRSAMAHFSIGKAMQHLFL